MSGELVPCVVDWVLSNDEVHLKPVEGTKRRTYVANADVLGELILRENHPVLARLVEPDEDFDYGKALEVIIDGSRKPKGEQKGRIKNYNSSEGWGYITSRDEPLEIRFYADDVGGDLRVSLDSGEVLGEPVLYEVGVKSRGLQAINIRFLQREYSGKVVKVRDDGVFAFLETDKEGKIPIGTNVFIHRDETVNRTGFMDGQKYMFNIESGEKGLRAIDAKLDKSHKLNKVGRVVYVGETEVRIICLKTGKKDYWNVERGVFKEGDFVDCVAEPEYGRVEHVTKREGPVGGQTLGCIIFYDRWKNIGRIIPSEDYKGVYNGEEIFFHLNDVLYTEDPRNPSIGRAVRMDIGKGKKRPRASNIVLLDEKIDIPGVRLDCEGGIARVMEEKGYGFVIYRGGKVFFHTSNYCDPRGNWGFDYNPPKEGMRANFGLMATKEGQAAFNVRIK